ncbi:MULTISPECIES: ABC transporter substrate-binding protein [Streptomyces]|uniref:Peptide ABC transporter substrate-binding protein n=1 Tax=Streptomyces koelreuteriae TaxID=2838015 RepID=A0ABX8FJ25_9ACTN|nr:MULTISPECIES: ABC transporter substrate-binding protein [Streptomyces]QWB21123.1 peptide ABC transporter substrate-binding protein [Streptomyces koelreuteriae]UUA04034.1 ABC transporter substrate-binding protein [Streptomyces koelreuteriae]UUA11659.1 ABC transporter substrate-binding protein [Streptomyces sp. CRCS-T-1]
MTGLRTTRSRPIVASLAALLAVSGCSVAGADPIGGGPGTLRIVLPEEPPTLEPCDASLTATGRVTRSNITEALTEREPSTGRLEPALATKWTRNSATSWTFTLRRGVTFHDGKPFTAAAAAFSVKRATDSKIDCNVDGYIFADSELTATPVDDTTLRVTTAKPDPILPLRLSFVEIVPTSTDPDSRVREPVGTGPYRIDDWNQGRHLRLKRFPGYWGKAPEFAAATYVWRAEGSVRAAMVTNNEADVAIGLAPEDGAGDRAVEFATNEVSYLRMDATKPPLDDIRIRQAVNYAIDREGLVTAVFAGRPTGQLVSKGVTGYNPGIKPWPYDPDRARRLVAEARADGVRTGTTLTLIGRNGIYPKAAEAMEVVQDGLIKAGLKVRIKMLDVNAWLEYLLRPFPAGDTGPTLLQAQHGNQAGDAAFTMGQIYGSEGAQSSYGTDALDTLIEEAQLASGGKRQKAFADAFSHQNDEVVRDAVMANMTGLLALSPKVRYRPDSATNDEMRLADMRRAD